MSYPTSSTFMPVLICAQCRSVLAYWGPPSQDDNFRYLTLQATCWQLLDGRWWVDSDSKSTPMQKVESVLVVCPKCGVSPVRVLRATGKRRSWSWFNPLTWVAGKDSWQLAASEAKPGAVSVAEGGRS